MSKLAMINLTTTIMALTTPMMITIVIIATIIITVITQLILGISGAIDNAVTIMKGIQEEIYHLVRGGMYVKIVIAVVGPVVIIINVGGGEECQAIKGIGKRMRSTKNGDHLSTKYVQLG